MGVRAFCFGIPAAVVLSGLGVALFGCATGEGLGGGIGANCNTDNDCRGDGVCVDGKCTDPLDLTNIGDSACTNDMDCEGDDICVGGLCVDPGEAPGPGGECLTDADCKGGRICINGNCEYPVPGDGCTSDSDCKGGRVCVDGQCVYPSSPPPDTGGCTDDSECKGDRVCIDGECVNPPATGGTGGGGAGGTGGTGGAGGSGEECGNGTIEGDEECDGEDLGGNDCESVGQGPGTLDCTDKCTFDITMCEVPDGGFSDGGLFDGGR